MPAVARGTRRSVGGFTLVELLVVSAIIGMLIALLLPSLQMAREASRRASCSNNFRQIGSAIHLYHDVHNAFPPGGVSMGDFNVRVRSRQQNLTTWTIQILPFMEQLPIYEKYSQGEMNDSRANKQVREHFIAAYSCPSDIYRKTLTEPATGPGHDNHVMYMPGSYRGVGGRGDGASGCWDGTCNPPSGKRPPRLWRGVFHVVDGSLSPESSGSIADGLSNTIMVGEYCTKASRTRIGLGRRTFWAYTHGSYNRSDVIPQSRTLLADYDRCASTRGIGDFEPCVRAWGSFHPGVVGFLLCDGSIKHVPLTVDMQCLASAATVAGKEFAPLPR